MVPLTSSSEATLCCACAGLGISPSAKSLAEVLGIARLSLEVMLRVALAVDESVAFAYEGAMVQTRRWLRMGKRL